MKGIGLVAALQMAGRSFIGDYRSNAGAANSKYWPHQGKRECARRLRQQAKIEARRSEGN